MAYVFTFGKDALMNDLLAVYLVLFHHLLGIKHDLLGERTAV
jgi:hypothetical protein